MDAAGLSVPGSHFGMATVHSALRPDLISTFDDISSVLGPVSPFVALRKVEMPLYFQQSAAWCRALGPSEFPSLNSLPDSSQASFGSSASMWALKSKQSCLSLANFFFFHNISDMEPFPSTKCGPGSQY